MGIIQRPPRVVLTPEERKERQRYFKSRQDQAVTPEEQEERARQRRREYHYANRERILATNRRWQKNNPERNAARALKYLARKAAAEGSFTFDEWRALCAKYGNRCLCCGKQTRLTPDHICPLSKGGSNWIDNIQPLCKLCNSSKGDREIDYRPS